VGIVPRTPQALSCPRNVPVEKSGDLASAHRVNWHGIGRAISPIRIGLLAPPPVEGCRPVSWIRSV